MSPNKHIMLVDDNDNSLDMLEVFLYNEFRLSTAQNGFEAIKLARSQIPDLIITDIMMPVVNGIRLFNLLKKEKDTEHIPVIAYTSFNEHTYKSLINIGFNSVIRKPFQRDELMGAINHLLNNPGSSVPEPEDTSGNG